MSESKDNCDVTWRDVLCLVAASHFLILLCWLEGMRCYRRLRGGVWERWWVEPCRSDIWHRVHDDPAERWPAKRPSPVCFGKPRVEDYR